MTTARLRALVDRVHHAEAHWERAFRENVPTYDPTDPVQPADDEHMGDWDELDDSRAQDSRTLLLALTAELEGIIAAAEGDR